MMKYLAYITGLLLLALCSCSDDLIPDTPNANVPDGTPIEISASAEFPEMNFGPTTRAMGDQPTADELLNSLKVNILVFDASGIMLQYIPPKDISITGVDEVNHIVHFRVKNIYSSTLPRRLHFVVTSAPDIREFEGGEFISSMANETTVMPALISSGDTDVYWGLSEVPEVKADMKLEMRVIRNFVKLNVAVNASDKTKDFKLLGYAVVNRPGKGTVAPYIYKDHIFASFLTPDNALNSYAELVRQGYRGINPAGSEETMTHTTKAEVEASLAASEALLTDSENPQDSPYYFYERSQSSVGNTGKDVKLTYLIVKGEYQGTVYYYKLDLGHLVNGNFKFYDLLRNFQYTININEVSGRGAASVEEAMTDGISYNNISASVVTRDLFSISYEGEIIEVSQTRVIFTEKSAEYTLKFRYIVPSGHTFVPADLKLYDLSKENTIYNMDTSAGQAIDLEGEVIESATLSDKDAEGWYTLTIATKDIPSDMRRFEQTLRVYYSGGTTNLSRTITLMLRQPWQLTGITSTTPEAAINNLFTVTFNVPEGLVSSQFPLILTFESDKQNMYGMQGTDLEVATGKSGFKGATTDNVILYEWNMSWADYYQHSADDNGVKKNGGEYTATFLTNTTSAEDKAYNTAGIDAATNGNRTTNNKGTTFCIRIANKGQKYIEPYYVNITRPEK